LHAIFLSDPQDAARKLGPHDSVATIQQINASKVPAFRVDIDISVTDGAGHLILFHRQLDGLEDRPFEFCLPSSNEWLKISVRFVGLTNLSGKGRNSETGRD
jgi:hypothetical protein